MFLYFVLLLLLLRTKKTQIKRRLNANFDCDHRYDFEDDQNITKSMDNLVYYWYTLYYDLQGHCFVRLFIR